MQAQCFKRAKQRAVGAFANGMSGLKPSGLSGAAGDYQRRPVIYAAGRFGKFQLGHDPGATGWNDPAEFHQRRIAKRIWNMLRLVYCPVSFANLARPSCAEPSACPSAQGVRSSAATTQWLCGPAE